MIRAAVLGLGLLVGSSVFAADDGCWNDISTFAFKQVDEEGPVPHCVEAEKLACRQAVETLKKLNDLSNFFPLGGLPVGTRPYGVQLKASYSAYDFAQSTLDAAGYYLGNSHMSEQFRRSIQKQVNEISKKCEAPARTVKIFQIPLA